MSKPRKPRKPTPKPAPDQHKGSGIFLRAESAEQLARWQMAAKADGRTFSGWARWVLDRAAK